MVTNVTSPVTAKRKEAVSPLRRTSEIVLVAGTVVAVIAAFGPTWAVRLGIVVAVISAVVACLFAWRELFNARRQHARAMLTASRDHGRALTDERTRNAVDDAFACYIGATSGPEQVVDSRADLHSYVSSNEFTMNCAAWVT